VAKTINFIFAVHNHQPVGNFPHILQQAYETAYLPFLDIFERFPAVKMTLHISGPLWEWLIANQPDYIERIKHLVDEGRVELMGGGFYEPLLPVIPREDACEQIKWMNNFIKDHFGVNAKGFWLAERVWEPSIPSIAGSAGMRYTAVDDVHFLYSGLSDEQLYGYYITEDAGYTLAVFPISQRLRYLIPFRLPEESLQFFGQLATEDGSRMVCLADDGEKFGVWPGTHEWVYGEKWLERFFTMLQENASWIRCLTFSEYMEKYPPLGRIYLPTASYEEMTTWALSPEASRKFEELLEELRESGEYERMRQFLRGGFWRNFLVKYSESNNMHKKMWYVSQKIREAESKGIRTKRAKRHLFMGQCNCAYWHGVFGGLYLPHLRSAVYKNLIEAERILDERLHGDGKWAEVCEQDFDADTAPEILLENPSMSLYIDPDYGAHIFELDFKERAHNLLDTLTRRPEAYHRDVVESARQKSDNLGTHASIHELQRVADEETVRMLKYDWYPRRALIDHFMALDTDIHTFADCQHNELGDFVNQPYEYRISRKRNKVVVELVREGFVWQDWEHCPLYLKKTISFPKQGGLVEIEYILENRAWKEINVLFGVEFNFAFMSGDSPSKYFLINGKEPEDSGLKSIRETEGVRDAAIVDEDLRLTVMLKWTAPACFWRFPIMTVSQSERAYEKTYQSSLVMPLWRLHLDVGENWNVKLKGELRAW